MRRARLLGAAALVGALAVASYLLVRGWSAGALALHPAAEVTSRLKSAEADRAPMDVPGTAAKLQPEKVRFDRIHVSTDDKGERATATATLDWVGTLGEVRVSSLGLERLTFLRESKGWRSPDSWAPGLRGACAALAARLLALNGADSQQILALLDRPREQVDPALQDFLALDDRHYRTKAWYLRLERDEAIVTEDYELSGKDKLGQPVRQTGQRRLGLVRRGEAFRFWPSLM